MGRDYSVYGSSRPSNGGESDDVHSSSNARALLFGKDGKKSTIGMDFRLDSDCSGSATLSP